MYISSRLCSVFALSVSVLTACGGGGDGGELPDKQTTYPVSGNVAGLGTSTLVLRITDGTRNVTEEVTVSGAGANDVRFTFPTELAPTTPYVVSIRPPPPSNLGCSITNAVGRVGEAAITNIAVSCAANGYTVSGTVTGLAGTGLELSNNGTDSISIVPGAPPTTFTFPTAISSVDGYAITVTRQPSNPSQTCVAGAATAGPPTGGNVTNATIACSTNSFLVGGTISGLQGTGLQLQNNNGDTLSITAGNTSFAFASPVMSGGAFNVTVLSQATNPAQSCIVVPATATGTVGTSNVTSVVINCAANSYTIGGTITGLTGSGLQLRNNNGPPLPVTPGSTSFTFPQPLPSGLAYSVTVVGPTSNPTQNCVVTPASATGTVGNTAVTSVVINCATNSFTVGGTISGLTGSGLQLRNNGGNLLNVAAGSTNFTFATPLVSGAPYNITVVGPTTNPVQNCIVAPATAAGIVGANNVTSVVINCATNSFTVGGSINGLTGTGLQLSNNGASPINVAAGSTTFTFPTPLASGAAYSVTVGGTIATPTQTCAVTPSTAAGTVSGSDVTDIVVNCTTSTFTIGGSITGLTGSGLQLRNNGSDTLSIGAGSTSFQFPIRVASGADYSVSVVAQPSNPGQQCSVQVGTATGRVGNGNVTSVVLDCSTVTYSIGGTVSGLGATSGLRLALRRDSAQVDFVDVPGDGAYTFAQKLIPGDDYAVTVLNNPTSYVCTPASATGTVPTSNVTNVAISCIIPTYPVSVVVTGLGLSNPGLLLANTFSTDTSPTSETVPIIGDGTFTFPTRLRGGRTYSVSVFTQHPDFLCTVNNGSGQIADAAINITATCNARTYAIGGNVTGLGTDSAGLRLRRDSTGRLSEEITVDPANPAFTFPTALPTNSTFTIVRVAEPEDRLCTFSNGTDNISGTINRAPITSIEMSCAAPPALVVTSAPLANATAVALSSQPTLTLSAALNAATINSTSVVLSTPQGMHPATIVVTGSTVTAQPLGKLAPGTTYTVTLSTGIRGTGKERLATSYAISFTTGNGWTAPQFIGAGSAANWDNPSPVRVRFSTNGNAVAMWEAIVYDVVCQPSPAGDICETFRIQTSLSSHQYSLSSGWAAAPATIDTGNPFSTYFAVHDLEMDANGNAIAVWSDNGSLKQSRLSAGAASWTAALDLSAIGNSVGAADLAMDRNGNAWLYTQESAGPMSMVARRRFSTLPSDWANGTWSAIETADSTAWLPLVAIGKDNHAIAIWQQYVPPSQYYGSIVTARVAPFGDAWSNLGVAATAGSEYIFSTALGVAQDDSGTATTVWAQGNGTNDSIFAKRYRPGIGWDSSPQPLELSSTAAGFPQIAHLGNGNELAVWLQCDASPCARYDVYAARFTAGGWETPQLLEFSDGSASVPEIAADQFGNAIVVWLQTGPNGSNIFANRYAAAIGTWSGPRQLENVIGEIGRVGVGTDPNGNAFAIWTKNSSVSVSRFE
jgi:hypothetical protein